MSDANEAGRHAAAGRSSSTRREWLLAAGAGLLATSAGCLGVVGRSRIEPAADPWRGVEVRADRGRPVVEGRAVLPEATFAARAVAPTTAGRLGIELEATAPVDFVVLSLGEFDRYRQGRRFRYVAAATRTTERRAQVPLEPGRYRWVFDNTAALAAAPSGAVGVSFRAFAEGL